MFQVPTGMYEMGVGQMPGLNTMANAYQQATQTLGPSLLSFMAAKKAHDDTLIMQQQQLKALTGYRDETQTANLLKALESTQAQIGMREQGKSATIASMMKDKDTLKSLQKAGMEQGYGKARPFWPDIQPTQQQLMQVASKQYDTINPMSGVQGLQNTSNQLQQLIAQKLANDLTTVTPQGGVPQGGMIRVRLANGQTGNIPQSSFDPSTMTMI